MGMVLVAQCSLLYSGHAQMERITALEQRLAETEAATEQMRVEAEASAQAAAPRDALVDELLEQRRTAVEAEQRRLAEEEARRTELASRGVARQLDVEVTGYCGGGVTATGQDVNTSREGAMCIAVDPGVIPLGSRVRLSFEEPWSYLDGVYIASDTGGAINGNIVDLYFGVDGYDEAVSFGRRMATAEVLY